MSTRTQYRLKRIELIGRAVMTLLEFLILDKKDMEKVNLTTLKMISERLEKERIRVFETSPSGKKAS